MRFPMAAIVVEIELRHQAKAHYPTTFHYLAFCAINNLVPLSFPERSRDA